MTQLQDAVEPSGTGAPLLEARHLTKHFPVHRAVSAGRAARGVRRALPGRRRAAANLFGRVAGARYPGSMQPLLR